MRELTGRWRCRFSNASEDLRISHCSSSPDRASNGDFVELDLGDRKVQFWHFGPSNTPGDTIVYVPEAKVARAGNFLSNELIGNTPREYLDTLARCKNALDM